MSFDDDYRLALELQMQFNESDNDVAPVVSAKRKHGRDDETRRGFDLNSTQNIAHPEWETIDPTPDIFSLFGAFDLKFFQGKLKCVELEWSKRMYQCAGICYQRRNGLGMAITIRLSEPLLKLRSRRDLIETLLHEMIHAYLFVLNVREGNGGHGPNFLRIMNNINKTAGTDISVYHTFHDEVEAYKTHIWRCNGICQHRKPFFGWVKRTCNRAPGPNDRWWAKHHESCGGCFQKVSEPEPKGSKAKKAKKDNNLPKITDYMPTGNIATLPKTGSFGATKSNGGGTILVKPTTQNRVPPSSTITSNPAVGGNLQNVVGFRDLTGDSNSVIKSTGIVPSGSGRVLGSSQSNNSSFTNLPVAETIRNVWANKFPTPTKSNKNQTQSSVEVVEVVEVKAGNSQNKVTEGSSMWEEIDEDLLVHNVQDTVIQIGDDSDDETTRAPVPVSNAASITSQRSIKQELLDDLGVDDADIEMIDDEFDETLRNESFEIFGDKSVIDDIFGTDTLMADFNEINNVVMKDPENRGNKNREIITCPICQDRMPREELSEHLDGCTGITVKVDAKRSGKNKKPLPFYKNQTKASTSQPIPVSNQRELLRKAGYGEATIEKLVKESQEEREYNARIMDEMASDRRQNRAVAATAIANVGQTILIDGDESNERAEPENADLAECPVCNAKIPASLMNEHLDVCLDMQNLG